MIVDKVMVAVGREPNIHNIGLMNTSVNFNEKGIEVNESYQTAESHIYAIGDCIPTLQQQRTIICMFQSSRMPISILLQELLKKFIA